MLANCDNDLPNPHRNCVREILSALICHDNDVRRIDVEMRNLQQLFKIEMERIEMRCGEARKPVCDGAEVLLDFTRHITTIHDMNECFSKKVETLKKQREEIIVAARQCLRDLNREKCKFKRFHENTVDYLKRYAIKSDDPIVIRNCEKDICEMHKLFVKEVSYIKKCEDELQPFFQLCDLQDLCQCCCFREYEWIPKGKSLAKVDELADKIKALMGQTLVKAFAQMHVMQPPDTKSFLATYLMNLEHNEDMLREKLDLFSHIK